MKNLAVTALAVSAAAVMPCPAAQAVSGGQQASHPAVVRLDIDTRPHDTPHHCTGTLLAGRWVLTAGHCVESDPDELPVTAARITVQLGNDVAHPTRRLAVDRFSVDPGSDLALVHLSSSANLSSYPAVATSVPAIGDTATLMGYGLRWHDEPATWLAKATLRLKGTEDNWGSGPLLRFAGVTGTSNRGDSGGPVLDGAGRLVGVNVRGSHAAYEYTREDCAAVDLTQRSAWIRQAMTQRSTPSR